MGRALFSLIPAPPANGVKSAQEGAVLRQILGELAAANAKIDAMIDDEIARSSHLESLDHLRAAKAALAGAMELTRERLAL